MAHPHHALSLNYQVIRARLKFQKVKRLDRCNYLEKARKLDMDLGNQIGSLILDYKHYLIVSSQNNSINNKRLNLFWKMRIRLLEITHLLTEWDLTHHESTSLSFKIRAKSKMDSYKTCIQKIKRFLNIQLDSLKSK